MAVPSAAAAAAKMAATTAAKATVTTSKAAPPSSYFKITLHRSSIGMPHRTCAVLTALGLHKRGKTVYHPVHPMFAGMIMKVKELVRVEEVPRKLTPTEIRAERTPDPGYWVEKKVERW